MKLQDLMQVPDLTLLDVTHIKNDIIASNPHAEVTEIVAAAWEKGYTAAIHDLPMWEKALEVVNDNESEVTQ